MYTVYDMLDEQLVNQLGEHKQYLTVRLKVDYNYFVYYMLAFDKVERKIILCRRSSAVFSRNTHRVN